MDRSMDSIGSCSLDVDAESTDISDTSGSLNFPTPISIKDITREFTNNIRERCSLQTAVKNTTAFVDPVTGQVCIALTQPATTTTTPPIIPVNNTIRKTIYRPVAIGPTISTAVSASSITKPITAILTSPQTPELFANEKKPSYLNLACCVNGYSNITTYDSKIRQDINKSREVSPIRPSTSALHYCKKSNSLAPPILLTMSNINGVKSTTQVPAVSSSGIIINSCDSSSEMNIGTRKHHYIETNGSASASGSTIMVENGTNELKKDDSQSKLSFIQQRVERLYGPGALAQGFYMPKKTKDTNLQYENGNVDDAASLAATNKTSSSALSPSRDSNQIKRKCNVTQAFSSTNCGSDNDLVIHDLNGDHNDDDDDDDVVIDLPCLRHLSQEFRAQLPSISPKRQYMVRNTNNEEQQQQEQKCQRQQMQQVQLQDFQIPRYVRNRSTKTLLNGGSGGGGGGDDEDSDDEAISLKNNGSNCGLDEVDRKIILGESMDDGANDNDELKASKPVTSSSVQQRDAITTNAIKNNCNSSAISTANAYEPIKKDGHYFLQQLKIEQERLLKLAATGDMYLKMLTEATGNHEDALGLLRSASGKARLLVSQKMKQFEGLCYNNLNSKADDKFPTTVDDLQGFWDMVYLQIDQVDSIFRDIEELKANNWKKSTGQLSQYTKHNGNGTDNSPGNATRSRLNNKRSNTKLTNGSSSMIGGPTTSTTPETKREIQRKKLQELKRRNRAAMMAADTEAETTTNKLCNSIITKDLS